MSDVAANMVIYHHVAVRRIVPRCSLLKNTNFRERWRNNDKTELYLLFSSVIRNCFVIAWHETAGNFRDTSINRASASKTQSWNNVVRLMSIRGLKHALHLNTALRQLGLPRETTFILITVNFRKPLLLKKAVCDESIMRLQCSWFIHDLEEPLSFQRTRTNDGIALMFSRGRSWNSYDRNS